MLERICKNMMILSVPLVCCVISTVAWYEVISNSAHLDWSAFQPHFNIGLACAISAGVVLLVVQHRGGLQARKAFDDGQRYGYQIGRHDGHTKGFLEAKGQYDQHATRFSHR